jgi:hypothetical protein
LGQRQCLQVTKAILTLYKNGTKPKDIAKHLCIKEGLTAGSIKAKDISNFIGNFKKAGILKLTKFF